MILWFVSAQSGVCLAFTGLSPTLLLSWLKGRESVMGSRRYFHFRFMRSWIKSPKKQINHKKLFFLLIKKYYLWWLWPC